MVDDKFDAWVRGLSASPSRRSLLQLVTGTALGALPAALFDRKSAHAGCKKVGKKCDKNKDCCDGARCEGDKKDKKGKCRCKAGLKDCPGENACKNLDADENHCGSCGNQCAAGEVCCSGACTQDSLWDTCGACGNQCALGEVCAADSDRCESCAVQAGVTVCDAIGAAGPIHQCGPDPQCRCSERAQGGSFCWSSAQCSNDEFNCTVDADCRSGDACLIAGSCPTLENCFGGTMCSQPCEAAPTRRTAARPSQGPVVEVIE